MTGKKTLGILAILALLGFGAAAPAMAQSSEAPARWTFEILPMFWASGLDINAQTSSGDQNINVDFSDIMKAIHFGALGTFEARKGRWGVLFDGMFVDLGQSIPQSGTMPGDVDLDMTQSCLSLAALYRVVQGKTAVDLVAGARYNYMNSILTVTSGPYTGYESVSKDNWVDGYGGVRLLYSPGAAWRIVGYVDAGAGGSELTWQARAGVNYAFSKVLSAELGYRHQYFKRATGEGDDTFAMAKSGFYLGLGIRF